MKFREKKNHIEHINKGAKQTAHKIHFMGIGGIGMSGLAEICLLDGYLVSGCDSKINSLSHRLSEKGADISIGHDVDHLNKKPDLLVYSSAVSLNEPELVQARLRGIRAITRGELLAEMVKHKRLIAIAGAHGKTTTSGMAAEVLLHAGWDPSVTVGGVVVSLGTNARWGSGSYFVAETDESDGSFLHLSPEIAIITNIDREHMNHYKSLERLVAAFRQFVDQMKPDGKLIRCYDDAIIRSTLSHRSQISYGFNPNADIVADRIVQSGYGSSFRASYFGRNLGRFMLQVPGRHNILNALGVISLGVSLELPLVIIMEALASYQGTERRFQVTHLPDDICFVEDYAHHPSEIVATLAADITAARHRVVVFQPHRFSRTKTLEREFMNCFDRADGVIVTDIYPAYEAPIPGISGERLAGLIKSNGHPCVRYVPKQEITSFIPRIVRSGDTMYFLGAGDIGELCNVVASKLHNTARRTVSEAHQL